MTVWPGWGLEPTEAGRRDGVLGKCSWNSRQVGALSLLPGLDVEVEVEGGGGEGAANPRLPGCPESFNYLLLLWGRDSRVEIWPSSYSQGRTNEVWTHDPQGRPRATAQENRAQPLVPSRAHTTLLPHCQGNCLEGPCCPV